jgi:hypothetical protein
VPAKDYFTAVLPGLDRRTLSEVANLTLADWSTGRAFRITGTPKRQTENSAHFDDSGPRIRLGPPNGDAPDPRISLLRALCCELTGGEIPHQKKWLPNETLALTLARVLPVLPGLFKGNLGRRALK